LLQKLFLPLDYLSQGIVRFITELPKTIGIDGEAAVADLPKTIGIDAEVSFDDEHVCS
jgi:hypothetical protein